MKQVMNAAMRAKEMEKQRAAVLRIEQDYGLATLHEAVEEKNFKKQANKKQKLEKIRKELIKLNAL